MCGIFFYESHNELEDKIISKTLKFLKKRGPDYQYYKHFKINNKNYYLFHSRLAIIDSDITSNQPLVSPDQNIIIFNGEIFNFKSLRSDLINKYKINFLTQSDTEVILRGYEKEGASFFDKLRGMFAFIIYDNKIKKFILASDQQSIKFLFSYQGNDEYIISSEVSIIKNFLKNKLTINSKSIEQIITFGSVQESTSLYDEISKFLPGYIYENDIFKNENFTKLKKISKIHFEFDLNKLIKESFYSEAKSSLLYSGGSDSSFLLNEIKNFDNNDLYLTRLRTDKNFESYFKIKHNIKSHDIEMDFNEIEKDFLNYPQLIDYPSDDGLNVFFITKKLKEIGVKVALSGAGGDEIFGGYQSRKFFNLFSHYYEIPFRKNFDKLFSFLFKSGNIKNKLLSIEHLNAYSPDILFLLRSIFTPYEKQKYFKIYNSFNNLTPSLYDNLIHNKFNTNFDLIHYFESEIYLSSQLLHIGDIASMQNSIEMRFPLLNLYYYKKFSEELINNDNKFKIYKKINGLEKKKFKKYYKEGFTIPIYKILLKNNAYIKNVILNSDFIKTYCNQTIEKLIDNLFINLRYKSNQHKISLLYNLSSWSY